MIPHAIDPAKARSLAETLLATGRTEEDALAVARFIVECWDLGFVACLKANYGDARGAVLFDLIFEKVGRDYRTLLSDSTRAATSKIVCRVRRGLEMPALYSKKGQGRGHKRGWQAKAKAKRDAESVLMKGAVQP